MDILYYYTQEKVEKTKNLVSNCELKLIDDAACLTYVSKFYSEYMRIGKLNAVKIEHTLIVDKKTGEINVGYNIINEKTNNILLRKTVKKLKKNDFQFLMDLSERGFYNGEKRIGYWGVKYGRAINEIFNLIKNTLTPNMNQTFILDKEYDLFKSYMNPLYDFVVDYHLNKQNVKQHDDVYIDILHCYPEKKWLKRNDNKFIPAVLDSYGLKGKYFIKEFTNRSVRLPLIPGSLNFLCKMFGDNYMDYLKKFDWKTICIEKLKYKKTYECKNNSERNFLVRTLNNWHPEEFNFDSPLHALFDLFTTREYIENKGVSLRFKSKSGQDFKFLKDEWESIKKHFKIGFKVRFDIPKDVIDELELPILCDDKQYHPRVLLSEDHFKVEGMIMHNCMGTQFNLGNYYLFISMSSDRKRVNTQYRKGKLIQSRGKTNIDLPEEFIKPVDILTKRVLKFKDLTWKKEKYDYIKD